MLIGEAVLKSPAFSPRLSLLVRDLRAAGCTVWLEGLRLRFDCADAQVESVKLGALLKRYQDVVECVPELRTKAQGSPPPVGAAKAARGKPFFAATKARSRANATPPLPKR